MKTAKPELSVVLPAYRERDNLAILIPDIEESFKNLSLEVIVVDDDSKDGTEELVRDLNERFGNVRIMVRQSTRGIGSAIRDGYNAAEGVYVLSADSDLSLPVGDMVRLYEKIREGFDMVVGYRYGTGGYYEKNKLSVKIKYLLSRPGSFLIRTLTGIKLRDFSNNSRIMKRGRWRELRTVDTGNAFLFEVILRASKKGFTIAEIPISFYKRRFGASKMVIWKEAPRFLMKVFWYTFFTR